MIDDYAHNPAKIAASWRAVAETAPRILGFWRPHGFGPLRLLERELADAFAAVCRPADRLFLLPVFYAGGTASRGLIFEEFAAVLYAREIPAEHAADIPALQRRLLDLARPGDVILGMGARDPALPRCARELVDALHRR